MLRIPHNKLLTSNDCRAFHKSWQRGAEHVAREKGAAFVFTMTGDVIVFYPQGEEGKIRRKTFRRGSFVLA